MAAVLSFTRTWPAVAAAALAIGWAGAASSQDRPSAFAGGFIADDYFVYLGGSVPLPGAQPDRGWAIRGIGSLGGYDYRRGTTDIEADYANVELALVHQRSGPWGWLNLAAGPRYSDTDLSQPDPINPREGQQWDAIVSADGARVMGDWRALGYASYAFDIEDFYVRGELTRAIRPRIRVGVEAVAEGDPTYDRQALGVVAVFAPMDRTEFRISLGGRAGDRSSDTYLSVGASRSF